MKKAIAMRCSQEQFDAIEPKLVGQEIELSVHSGFEDFPYLTNPYKGIATHVGNYKIPDTLRDVYETWNEKVFLEACGIVVFPTHEEIEEQFKNAETIQCLDDNDEYIIDFTQEIDVTKSCIWLLNQVDKPYSGRNTMCKIWSLKYGYAKILTYKKPIRTNKLTELEKRVSVLENKVDLKKITDMPKNPMKMNFGIDFGKSDSNNDILMPNAINSSWLNEVFGVPHKLIINPNPIGENIKLKARIEELEAELKHILAGGKSKWEKEIEELKTYNSEILKAVNLKTDEVLKIAKHNEILKVLASEKLGVVLDKLVDELFDKINIDMK